MPEVNAPLEAAAQRAGKHASECVGVSRYVVLRTLNALQKLNGVSGQCGSRSVQESYQPQVARVTDLIQIAIPRPSLAVC